jgi:RNA polymerase sigma factor (sigma-70 family)
MNEMLSQHEFTAIIEMYSVPLHRFLNTWVADSELARDLTQDVFLDAWSMIVAKKPPFQVSAKEEERRRWLYRVAYNKGVSALRRRSRITWQSLSDDTDHVLPQALVIPSFETQWLHLETLRAALARLTPADVTSLVLTTIVGFTAAETAAILDETESSVAKRVSRAKRRLLEMYQQSNLTSFEGRQS